MKHIILFNSFNLTKSLTCYALAVLSRMTSHFSVKLCFNNIHFDQ